MKKSGFTIVELLAVIVIMAVIIAVGTTSFTIITERIQETSLKNKQSYLEIAAIKYAEETGFLATNVDHLVKLGYVAADTEDGKVINPMNGEALNCQVIRLTHDGHFFYATYTEEVECNNDMPKSNVYLKIEKYKSLDDGSYDEREKVEDDEDWVNQNLILVATFLDINTSEEDVVKVVWKSNAEVIEKEVNENYSFRDQNTFVVQAEQLINTIYSVQVFMKDGTTYEAQIPVKIDKQAPVVFQDEIKVSLKDDSARSSEVKVVASDGNGAGLARYYVGPNSNCLAVSDIQYLPSESSVYKTIVGRGIYYVCVKDQLGNLSEPISTKVIDLVNFLPPTLVVKEDPLVLTSESLNENYLFKDNILTDYGIFEEAQLSCNPTSASELTAHEVTCTAVSTNGLSSTIAFLVQQG